ncbi:MAG: nitroreductase family deazaflavin-dependent oxidoreductase [Chloroflexota bacterium]|nr:MAG: nitroreductase family deazaflavin-dependent oxidoreductase [Chloroflexota bacterium]
MADQGPLTDAGGRSRPDEVGDQLTDWGKVVRIATRGRVSGHEVAVAVGYVEEPDRSLLVAAGDPDADWARNLEADPACQVTVGERSWAAIAEPLSRDEAARAVTLLILRYGTPAERLGRGPGFRLRAAD